MDRRRFLAGTAGLTAAAAVTTAGEARDAVTELTRSLNPRLAQARPTRLVETFAAHCRAYFAGQ